MKKKLNPVVPWRFSPEFKKIYLRMKLILVILLAAILQSFASGLYSQTTTLSINLKNAKVETVLQQIEDQTEFIFLYSRSVIDVERPVDVDVKNAKIAEVLNLLFNGTDVDYQVDEKQIVLSKKESNTNVNIQQHQSISGKVTDSSGSPLPGVSIVLKGTTSSATVTDPYGNFSLSNIPKETILVFSFIGMETQEVAVLGKTNLEIKLAEKTIGLNEVVAVGYGTQKKSTLTGSVSSVKNAELIVAPMASTANTLAGRLPGLVSVQSSGQPGDDAANLSIRGFGSPLVIVDGIESNFNAIDANQIENISILKDGAASIYGARASNGVLLVTTKRGNNGKPIISLNTSFTQQSITSFPKMASSGQRAEMQSEAYLQSGRPPSRVPYTEQEIQKYYDGTDPQYPNTDWYTHLIRDYAPMQQHNISIRGGSDKIKYFGFLGMMDQESIWKSGNGQKYGRYNLQSNMDAQVTKNLSLRIDLQSTIEYRDYPWRSIDKSMWDDFWDTSPMYPSVFPDPDKISNAGGGGTGGAHITTNSKLSGYDNKDNQSIKGTISLKYNFEQVPGLSANLFFNYNKGYYYTKTLAKPVPYYTYDYETALYAHVGTLNAVSRLDESFAQGRDITSQFSLEYNKVINTDHSIKALVLYEGIDQKYNSFGGGRSNLLTTSIDQLFAGDVASSTIDGSATENGRVSYVSRLNYDFKDKYLIEGIFRADASARFPKESRWGYFPSISAGWRLSEEKFISDRVNFIDNLKLRASYGESGNDNVSNFAYLSTYKIGLPDIIGEKQVNGLISTGLANPTLTWENITIYDLGLDFSFFKKKLYGEFDFFYRERNGIPATRINSFPSTFGSALPPENLNSMNNRGWELMLGTAGGEIGSFKYSVTGNISWTRAKWGHYEEPEYADPDQMRIQAKSGQWTDVQYGYVSDGLFTSKEEIAALDFDQDLKGNKTLKIGDIKYVDVNKDGLLNWKDQVTIGKGTTPHYYFGLNVNMAYKSFDLSALIQGAFDYYNNIRLWETLGNKSSVVYDLRWTEANNDKYALIARLGGAPTNLLNSDYYLRKSAYARIKTMSLGYNVPSSFLKKSGLLSVRVYLAGTNLWTANKLKKYEIDPEAPSDVTGKTYPQQRTISAGLNITF